MNAATDSIAGLTEQLRSLRQRHGSGQLDQDSWHKARKPLERRLVDLLLDAPAPPSAAAAAPTRLSLGMKLGIGVVVLGLAGIGYVMTGSPQQIGQPVAQGPAMGANGEAREAPPHEMGNAEMAAMAERLAERLKNQPDDADGWVMLGRTYNAMGDAPQAVAAFERVLKLRPNDASTMADYADALAVKNGRTLAGEPMKLIQKALGIDPNNLKALALAGTDAFNRADYALAVKHWEHMVKVGPADHPLVEQIRGGIDEARQRGKLGPATAAAPAGAAPAAAAGVGAISGVVTLSPELKAKVNPDDVLFVYARPAQGSRMPLAILRARAADLPYRFTLDDSHSMSPAAKLSTAGDVVISARISKNGQSATQPGDLEGVSAVANAGAQGVQVVVATVIQ